MAPIVPFRIEVPERDIADLRERLARTRWPDEETVGDWSQGMPLSYARDLAQYWRDGYDWRRRESRLNRFEQYRTEIDGVDVHFLHRRSRHPGALPLVITHGWPGSVVEFDKIIEPLTDPTVHGGRAEDAFDVVCPSLPGYGFSGKPTSPGWGVDRIAAAWETLMARLGYDRYGAQGGDWGAAVTTAIGRRRGRCVAIHLTMPVAGPPSDLTDPTEEERDALRAAKYYEKQDSAYFKQQATRPQTLGYGLADSPTAQLTWIVEKFWSWTDNDGHPESALTRDEMLDNVMLYWLTNSGASSARLYWESSSFFGGSGRVELPTGVAMFPAEIVRPPRHWCEPAYNITHWTTMPRGGHFAAFEQPDLLVEDLRTFFGTVR